MQATAAAEPRFNRFYDYLGIFWLCLGILLYEVTLTRIFSFVIWSHFAFLIVSTALFGFGLAGVWLSIARDKQWSLDKWLTPWLAAGFSLAAVLSLVVIRFVPLQLSGLNHFIQWLNLFAVYLALIAPFFLSGLAIAILLSGEATQVHKLYFFDLLGAAIGSILIVFVITPLGATGSLLLACFLGLFAAAFFAWPQGRGKSLSLAVAACLCLLAVPHGESILPLVSHTTKRITQSEIDDALVSKWSILSRIDVVKRADGSPDIIFINGGENQSSFGFFERRGEKTLYWQMDQNAPYLWLNPEVRGIKPRVAIIGSSGGSEVVFALNHGAGQVDAIEMDPMIVDLQRTTLRKWNDGLYELPNVNLILNEGRSFIAHSKKTYDLIQMVNNHTPIALASGAINLSETYLLTVEGVADYLRHLSPDGILSISRWGEMRLLTILREAGRRLGIKDMAGKVALLKSTEIHSTLFFSMKPFTADEIARLRRWAGQYGKSILYEPSMSPQANIFSRIVNAEDPSLFYDFVGFDISPTSDDRPFFDHMILIGQHVDLDHGWVTPGTRAWAEMTFWQPPLDGLWGLLEKFPIPKGEVPLIIIALQSLLLAVVLIYLPLRFFKKRGQLQESRWPVLAYFSILGAAFIMIELCYIKQYILFLGYPSLSIALVIASLLLFSGIGSFVSERFGDHPAKALRLVFPAIFAVNLIMLWFTGMVFDLALGWPMAARVVLAMALIAPMGLLMGMPFPLGLRLVHRISPNLVGWAWGVNGFMTVVGSIVTVFIAIFFGFQAVILTAGALYLLTALVTPQLAKGADA